MNLQLQNSAFAILYRTNAQSRILEEALRKLNIPCRIFGGLSFYQRKEVKDLLSYFRLTINLKDEDALLRVINYPARGIGKTTLEKLLVTADQAKKSLVEILEDPGTYRSGFPSGSWQKMSDFVTMIRSFTTMVKTRNAFDLAKYIAGSSGLLKELHEDKTPEGVSRYENIEELLNAIKEFTETDRPADISTGEIDTSARTLDEFMQDIALITDADSKKDDDTNKVTLMTIHSAKGLEFPHVYLVGLEENLFPSIQSIGSRSDLEEERRLFYVAITRAEKNLVVSYAENRYRWGTPTICEPSRFLKEIPEQLLEQPRRIAPARSAGFGDKDNFSAALAGVKLPARKTAAPPNFQKVSTTRTTPAENPSDIEDIQAGMEVVHERFGQGKVVALEGSGPNKKATVLFPGIGQKQLLLRFARLKIVS